MKKLMFFSVIVSIFLLNSCSDNPVGGSGTVNITRPSQDYEKETPPVYINPGYTYDLLNAGDTGAVYIIDYRLDTILVDVTKLDLIVSHNGTFDTLVHNLTNPGIGFIGTIFSDTASTPIQNGSGTYTGYFKPYKPLSVFRGSNLNGSWDLIINYWGNDRTGVIKSWGITITYNQANSGNNIFPFIPGNYWIFKDSLWDGTITYDTLLVVDKSRLHGKEVFWWRWRNSNTTYYVRGENDGIYDYGNNFDTSYLTPNLWFKYPVNQGEYWYSRHWLLYNGIDTMSCLSVNSVCGGFTECIKYADYNSDTLKSNKLNGLFSKFPKKDAPKTSYYAEYYFKPGIGYVGADIYESGLFWFRFYCIQYKIN